MGRRSAYAHTSSSSSLRSVGAFGDSFSCSEFGACDLDLDAEDFEAIALEAEAMAQERIHKAKQRKSEIDDFFEFESDDADGPSGNGNNRTRPSAEGSIGNKSKKSESEPQKIFKRDVDKREGQGSTRQDTDTRTLPASNGVSEHRRYRGNRDRGRGRDTISSENSVSFSVGSGNVIKTDGKSGMELVSAQCGGVPGAAIHISSPNVVINYIIENKVESVAPTASIGFVASGGDSELRSPEQAENNIMPDVASLGTEDRPTGSCDKGQRNFRGSVREEGVTEKETAAQQMSQTKFKATGSTLDRKLYRENWLANMSKRGSLTSSAPNVTASLSTNMSRNLPERNASEGSVLKSTAPRHNLSEMLDSLWNPSNSGPPATPGIIPAMGTSTDSGARRSAKGPKALDAGCGSGAPAHPQRAPREGGILRNSRGCPTTVSWSSTVGVGEEQCQNQGLQSALASRREAGEIDEASRRKRVGLTSNPGSSSRGEAQNASRMSTSQEGKVGGIPCLTGRVNPQQLAPEEGAINIRKSQSRSTAHGKDLAFTRSRVSPSKEGEEDSKEATLLQGKHFQEDLTGGQHSSLSRESPKKHDRRKILAALPSTSERTLNLSVYEDTDMSDSISADQDDQLPKKQHPRRKLEENNNGSIVASAVPPIETDADVSEFAKEFVNQLKRSDIEEVDARHAGVTSTSKRGRRRATTSGKIDNKVGLNSADSRRANVSGHIDNEVGVNSLKTGQITQSNGKGQFNHSVHSHPPGRGQAQRQERSKSTKNLLRSELTRRGEFIRSQSAYPSVVTSKFDDRDKSTSRLRSSSRGRSRSGSSSYSQGTKYSVGDSLQSENDIIFDSNVEKIVGLKVFECCMVRRSGGRWTYSIVTEANNNEMTFVLDKDGKQKKIERHALLHNVRRINNAECSRGKQK